ncbi:hypothetical protein [Mycobacterium avium]|uniref:hypothetical protein n=1 Tax=Mycobacterium avium TaxID=1764 RepID=UPI00191C74A7|nr:hypothetical protein [Mycobacterium avium]
MVLQVTASPGSYHSSGVLGVVAAAEQMISAVKCDKGFRVPRDVEEAKPGGEV